MDSQEIEQAFDALYMAIQYGHTSAAKRVFEKMLEQAYEEKMAWISSEVRSIARGLGNADCYAISPLALKLYSYELFQLAEKLDVELHNNKCNLLSS